MDSKVDVNFDSWLKQLLDSSDVDGEVFGEYISGTLGTMEESTADEISENIRDILSGCVEDEAACSTMAAVITEKWMTETVRKKEEAMKQNELERQREMERQTVASSQEKDVSSTRLAATVLGGLSEVEKKRLVAQYDCESSDDEELEDGEDLVKESKGSGRGGAATLQGLFQNINASHVVEAEQQKKKEQKAAHEAKVERDRKSRETQKQKAQDRKEKEKKRTQKHERKR